MYFVLPFASQSVDALVGLSYVDGSMVVKVVRLVAVNDGHWMTSDTECDDSWMHSPQLIERCDLVVVKVIQMWFIVEHIVVLARLWCVELLAQLFDHLSERMCDHGSFAVFGDIDFELVNIRLYVEHHRSRGSYVDWPITIRCKVHQEPT